MILRVHAATKISGITIGACILKTVEQLPFSHVAVELPFEIIFESVPGGVRLIPRNHWVKEYAIVKTFELETHGIREKLPSIVSTVIGDLYERPYAYLSVLSAGVVIAFGRFAWARRLARKVGSSYGQICTELVGRFLDAIGLWKGPRSFDTLRLKEVYRELWRLENAKKLRPSI